MSGPTLFGALGIGVDIGVSFPLKSQYSARLAATSACGGDVRFPRQEVLMKKSVWTSIQNILLKLLKIGLLSYVILLFSFVGIKGSINTTYAMRLSSLQTLAPLDTTTPTP